MIESFILLQRLVGREKVLYRASFSSLLGRCSLPPLLLLVRYAQAAFVRSDAVFALPLI
jgi:hypothetical protein